MIEKMDHLFVIAVLIAFVIIYYLFGVKQVKDKLKLIYKTDSPIMNEILSSTNLRTFEFFTCKDDV